MPLAMSRRAKKWELPLLVTDSAADSVRRNILAGIAAPEAVNPYPQTMMRTFLFRVIVSLGNARKIEVAFSFRTSLARRKARRQ